MCRIMGRMRGVMIRADDWIPTIIPFIEEGKTVKIMPQGFSMVPFITGGRDEVNLVQIKGELKRGDIVVYRRDNAIYVLHRVYKIKNGEYYMLGDAQTEVEGPLRREQMIAKVESYYRKGKLIVCQSRREKVEYTLWFAIRPLRPLVIKMNNLKNKILRRK